MRKIRITDLAVYAYHGVYETEKKLGQNFLVSAELAVQIGMDPEVDELNATIDYGAVCFAVRDFLTANRYNLIETAADQLTRFLLKKYPIVSAVQIEIKKPDAPIGLSVACVSAVCSRARHTAFIGLGSNLGDRVQTLDDALCALDAREDCAVIKVSPFKNTAPYGNPDQPDFLNAAVQISTVLEPLELLRALHEVENRFGRIRAEKWGPRTLDLDILFYDDLVMSVPELTIPHADLSRRFFVLDALCALNPNLIHPVSRLSVRCLLDALSTVKEPG